MFWIRAFRFRIAWFMALLLVISFLYALRQYYLEQAADRAIEAWSWAVANRIIVVDPGHGGIDPGAVGPSGIKEKDITLMVGQKLGRILSGAGAAVILTREEDVDLSDPGPGTLLEKKRQDLARRVAYANQREADLFLSIHVNSFPSSRWWGAQTFYLRDSPTGKQLAQAIQEELIRVLGDNNRRKVKPEIYFIMQNTHMPAVIIEVGFISNPREEKLLMDPLYQEKIAQAIYAGVVQYYRQEFKARSEPLTGDT